MRDNPKDIIIYAGMLIVAIAAAFAFIFVINTLSCVSKPEIIKDEPMICSEAKQLVYYATVTKNQSLPESVSTESVRGCIATIRYNDCKKERDSFYSEHKYDPTKFDNANWNLYSRANELYEKCLKDSSK